MFYMRLGVILDLMYQLIMHLWSRKNTQDEDGTAPPSSRSLRSFAFADEHCNMSGPSERMITEFKNVFEGWVRPLKTPAKAAHAVEQQVQGYAHRLQMLGSSQGSSGSGFSQ